MEASRARSHSASRPSFRSTRSRRSSPPQSRRAAPFHRASRTDLGLRARELVYDATGRLRAGWRLAAVLTAFVITQPFAIWIALAAAQAMSRPVNALEIGPITSVVALLVAHV